MAIMTVPESLAGTGEADGVEPPKRPLIMAAIFELFERCKSEILIVGVGNP